MNEKLPWTIPEVDLLRCMMEGGSQPSAIGHLIGRTEDAVRTKWRTIRDRQTDRRPEAIFHQRWMAAYGNRAYPRYKVDSLDAVPVSRDYGANRMTMGGVAVYG